MPRRFAGLRRLSTLMALVAMLGLLLGVTLQIDRLITRSRAYRQRAVDHGRQVAYWRDTQLRTLEFIDHLRSEADEARRAAESDRPGLTPGLWRKRAELMDGAADEMRASRYETARARLEFHDHWKDRYERAASRPWIVLPLGPIGP